MASRGTGQGRKIAGVQRRTPLQSLATCLSTFVWRSTRGEKLAMAKSRTNEQEQIDRGVGLAYFILGQKGMALRVVEEALCSLDLMLGKQDKIRRNYQTLMGFVKWEERARPVRTTVKLTPAQMFQWLVYEKSEARERDTEFNDSPYPPSQDDMVVRYIKHLVRITMKRNSFYVTLGVGRLLYEYGTQEVKLMYDVLTQSDSARMKEMNYLRKQKMILMEKIFERFGQMIQTVTTAHGEKRFDVQPTTDRLVRLVNECLKRFTPWGTTCVIEPQFDPTSVLPLYYAGTNSADEDAVEMNRIHTVLHSECFPQFIGGLSQFVSRLPPDSPDKGCAFESPRERLAVPQFGDAANGQPRGDRFSRPQLEPEDYRLLQSRRNAQARRRKAYAAEQLRVHVDGFERAAFDPRRTTRIQLEIEPEADLIEVRGEDAEGELLLATLIVCPADIPPGGIFKDRIVLEGGQKIMIQLTPISDTEGELLNVQVDVSYAETNLSRVIVLAAQRGWSALLNLTKPQSRSQEMLKPAYLWFSRAGIAAALAITILTVIWLQQPQNPPDLPPAPAPSAQGPTILPPEPISPMPPMPSPAQPTLRPEVPMLIARANWNTEPEAAFRAMRIESVRGEAMSVDLTKDRVELLLNFPAEDEEGDTINRYRISLASEGELIWRRTLRSPQLSPDSNAHILELRIFASQFPKTEPIHIKIEGQTGKGWREVGSLLLQRKKPTKNGQ